MSGCRSWWIIEAYAAEIVEAAERPTIQFHHPLCPISITTVMLALHSLVSPDSATVKYTSRVRDWEWMFHQSSIPGGCCEGFEGSQLLNINWFDHALLCDKKTGIFFVSHCLDVVILTNQITRSSYTRF